MAKKKEVAYTPIIQAPTQEQLNTLNQIQLKVIPPYPDEGVQFSNYYKKQISNNEYQLIKQVQYNGRVRIDNTTTAQTFPNSLLNGRKFFLTDIFIAFQDESGIASTSPRRISIGVKVGVTGAFTSFLTIPHVFEANGRYMKEIQLKTPIALSGNNQALDLLAVEDTSGGGADIEITISGWFE